MPASALRAAPCTATLPAGPRRRSVGDAIHDGAPRHVRGTIGGPTSAPGPGQGRTLPISAASTTWSRQPWPDVAGEVRIGIVGGRTCRGEVNSIRQRLRQKDELTYAASLLTSIEISVCLTPCNGSSSHEPRTPRRGRSCFRSRAGASSPT